MERGSQTEKKQRPRACGRSVTLHKICYGKLRRAPTGRIIMYDVAMAGEFGQARTLAKAWDVERMFFAQLIVTQFYATLRGGCGPGDDGNQGFNDHVFASAVTTPGGVGAGLAPREFSERM